MFKRYDDFDCHPEQFQREANELLARQQRQQRLRVAGYALGAALTAIVALAMVTR